MMQRTILVLGLALIVAAACTGAGSTSPTPNPTPSPVPTPGPEKTLADLKYALIEGFGPLWFCDPDFYPIQRQDEIDAAKERWAEVTADAEAFEAITTRLDLDPEGSFSDDEKLEVYRAWKVLNAIALDPLGNDTYRFDYLAQPAPGQTEGTRKAGTISASGDVDVEQQAAAGEPMCPICLARGTRIETPGGGTTIEDLRIGDPVWTLDARGARVLGTVIALGSTAAPANHQVVRLVLADGRTVTASPGHPLADGRQLGDLRAGDAVDGSVVVAADLVAYDATRTYDIVASGPTGMYLVDGIALGSTLRP
jgi:hypothetical protein